MKLAIIEQQHILSTLRDQQGNRTHAARVLGIGLRTLQRKLKQWNVEAYGKGAGSALSRSQEGA